MKLTRWFAMPVALSLAGVVSAQPPEGGPGGPRGPMPPHPVVIALDEDGDGEISAKEIENAAAALKTLDVNEDGKLSRQELSPGFGPGGPRGFGFGFGQRRDGDAPGREGPPGRGGEPGREGPPRGGPPDRPEADREEGREGQNMISRIMAFDRDNDGKVSKAELPERMHSLFARLDVNKDDALTRDELSSVQPLVRPTEPGPGAPGFRPDAPGFRGGGLPGPPSLEAFVSRIMQFDDDNDGKLSREELTRFGQEFLRARSEPRGRNPEETGRPRRPAEE